MNLRLLLRLSGPALALSGLLLLLGGGTAAYLYWLQQDTQAILRHHLTSLRGAERLVLSVRDERTYLNRYLISGDPRELDEIDEAIKEVDRWLLEVRGLAVTQRGKEMLAKIDADHQTFKTRLAEIRAEPAGIFKQVKLRELKENLLSPDVLGMAQEYLDKKQVDVGAVTDHQQALSRWLMLGLITLGACGALAGALAGVSLAWNLSRSIVELNVPIQSVAGHLDKLVGPVSIQAAGNLQEVHGLLEETASRLADAVAQAQARELQALRSEQLAAVGQLAAGMAHELRNPLTSMKILVQSAALRGDTAALSPRDVRVLEQEISRLEGLITMFLDFARPRQPKREPVDLAELGRETAALVNQRATRQGVTIAWEAADPLVAPCDASQIRQVLLNLLLNALDASPTGGAVRARLTRGEFAVELGDGRQIVPAACLEVRDEGPGLSDELRERIFEPFFSTKETGTGLGLSICRKIVDLHRGEILVDAAPEGGARFRVLIPLDELPAESPGAADEPSGANVLAGSPAAAIPS